MTVMNFEAITKDDKEKLDVLAKCTRCRTLQAVSNEYGIPMQTLIFWNKNGKDYQKRVARFMMRVERSVLHDFEVLNPVKDSDISRVFLMNKDTIFEFDFDEGWKGRFIDVVRKFDRDLLYMVERLIFY